MNTQTTTQVSGSGDQSLSLYDALMGTIEIELTSFMLPTLKEKYKDETPEQRATRFKRYERAFKQYLKLWEKCKAAYKNEVQKIKKTVLNAVQQKTKKNEEADMFSLEDSIDAA